MIMRFMLAHLRRGQSLWWTQSGLYFLTEAEIYFFHVGVVTAHLSAEIMEITCFTFRQMGYSKMASFLIFIGLSKNVP